MTTREAIDFLHSLPGLIFGADLVEFNPVRDPAGVTAGVAAKLTQAIIGRMVNKWWYNFADAFG